MNLVEEERQLREAIKAAREMHAKALEMTENFPPEGRVLRDKIRAAAQRTVVNLELALEALLKDKAAIH